MYIYIYISLSLSIYIYYTYVYIYINGVVLVVYRLPPLAWRRRQYLIYVTLHALIY